MGEETAEMGHNDQCQGISQGRARSLAKLAEGVPAEAIHSEK